MEHKDSKHDENNTSSSRIRELFFQKFLHFPALSGEEVNQSLQEAGVGTFSRLYLYWSLFSGPGTFYVCSFTDACLVVWWLSFSLFFLSIGILFSTPFIAILACAAGINAVSALVYLKLVEKRNNNLGEK